MYLSFGLQDFEKTLLPGEYFLFNNGTVGQLRVPTNFVRNKSELMNRK